MNIIYSLFCFFLFFTVNLENEVYSQGMITHDKQNGSVLIKDGKGNLSLKLLYKSRCVISDVEVMNKNVVANAAGIYSAIKVGNDWFTTAESIKDPSISVAGNTVEIANISFGSQERFVTEKWIFKTYADYIEWTIERKYSGEMQLEDTGIPQWSFNNMKTWTGALLGTGGVAWCKLFDKVNASLANHTGEVALWNQENKSGLFIKSINNPGQQMALRFSRQPDERWTLNFTASEQRTGTRHTLSRFINDRQDIWSPITVRGTAKVTYRLAAFDYDTAYDRGKFAGLNGESIRSVMNTIARVGVIDDKIMGSNNWHVDAGYAVLHEHWIAQMGLGINDSNYLSNYKKTLDNYRDNAISADGRVKSRWAYNKADAEPGTYDEKGFYEAQWGRLLDANTGQVTNVAELFQINGDLEWVRTHKASCEKVLEFLLRRDSDNDGLVEALTESYKEKKGSDWIDVIWASWENAFINAELYQALLEWAEVEQLLGDKPRADNYIALAAKLKKRFNQPVNEGGFWDPEKEWYVYWRDKDDRIHGSNLVTPVNFMAIAYNICDDKNRQAAILKKTEELMQKESLFMWPISFFPYAEDEGLHVNYPFPNYENGDIFLGWGELGVRAYKNYDPAIAVRYISNVLAQYEKDGLAFQRYSRVKGEGRGNDILANNSLSIVGLYRNIYGIQPKYNRLYLAPHLTKDLNGTRVKYWMRGVNYMIGLSVDDYTINANLFTIQSNNSFGMSTHKNQLRYFYNDNAAPSMTLTLDKAQETRLTISSWQPEEKKWALTSTGKNAAKIKYEIAGLLPGTTYSIFKNNKGFMKLRSDNLGQIVFSDTSSSQGNNYSLTAN